MKNSINIFIKFFISLIINFFLFQPVFAQFDNPIAEGDLKSFLIKIAAVLTAFAGAIFVFMFFYSGILYMTASGNPEMEEKAKKSLVWGIIGILIVAMAGTIVSYVGGGFSQIFQ